MHGVKKCGKTASMTKLISIINGYGEIVFSMMNATSIARITFQTWNLNELECDDVDFSFIYLFYLFLFL